MNSKTAALLPTSSSRSVSTTTPPTTAAAFYKTSSSSSVLTDNFQTLITFPPPTGTIKIKRGPTINIKRQSPSSKSQHIIGSKLPWINKNNDDSDSENNNE